MKGPILTYILLVSATAVWCAMILAAPIAEIAGWTALADVLYAFFGTVCHQLDSHSLHLGIEKLGVCARCTAMYFGFFAGLIVYPSIRRLDDARLPQPFWLIIAALPMVLDVVLTVARLHNSTMETRLVTGGLFGFAVSFTIVPGLVHSIPHLFSILRRTHANETK